MLHTLRFFFSSKYRLFHNATFFGSCIIRILHVIVEQIGVQLSSLIFITKLIKALFLPQFIIVSPSMHNWFINPKQHAEM
jgi:hypothetical protein